MFLSPGILERGKGHVPQRSYLEGWLPFTPISPFPLLLPSLSHLPVQPPAPAEMILGGF